MAADAPKRGGLRRVFSHRNFAIFASGNFPSQLGVWAQRVALGWLAWKLTESGLMLGLLGFVDLIPIILLSPFSGYITDRFDRLALAKLIMSMNVVVTTTLASLAYLDLLNIYFLLLFAFLTGIDHAMFQPVRSVLISSLVSKEDLGAAIAINGFSWNSARFIGPAIAGIVLAGDDVVAADANIIFLVNGILYGWFLMSFWVLRLPPQPPRKMSTTSMGGEIVAGYRYVFRHPVIGPLLAILACASFLTRPVVELLPGIAEGVFDQGAHGLAWLTSAMGLGAMASGFWIAQRGRIEGMPRITANTLLSGVFVLILFSWTDHFAVAVLCMAAIGFQYSLYATCIQTMVQSVAEEHMRGRVLALYGVTWIGFAAFGSLVMGALSEWFGLRVPIGAGGVLCVLVWLWASRVQVRVAAELDAAGIK
ncbi:MAG: MFS transporter [Rhodospirillaceae bacterium]|nr:MFS transporter [Rhodospirillaceae bacterium]MBT5458997.1 MFS transporter [Rhodospirillaceae bacterium]